MALTELCSLKPFLGVDLSETKYDAMLKGLITLVSDWIEDYCSRKFGPATYTEFYSGLGYPKLALNQRPVTQVVSVFTDEVGYWGDAPGSFTKQLVEGVDFALERDLPDDTSNSGLLYRIGGVWERPIVWQPGVISALQGPTNGNVKVTYTAGLAVPGAVQMAANTGIARLWQTGKFGAALASESYSDYAYSLASQNPDDLFAPIKPFLIKWKNIVVG